MISIHKDSHLDHGIPQCVVDHVRKHFKDRTEFFVETIEYPEEETLCTSLNNWQNPGQPYQSRLPPIPCGLHFDVPESEVYYDKRGEREWESRLTCKPLRMVREVTIVAGPHPDQPEAGMILFTMYGGPAAPREPGDPSLEGEALEEAKKFWKTAALAQRRFSIDVLEVHVNRVYIRAGSKEEALKKLKRDGYEHSIDLEYSHDLPEDTWDVHDQTEFEKPE